MNVSYPCSLTGRPWLGPGKILWQLPWAGRLLHTQSLPALASTQCVSPAHGSPPRGTEPASDCAVSSSHSQVRHFAHWGRVYVHMCTCVCLFINTGSLGMLHEQSHDTWKKHEVYGDSFLNKKWIRLKMELLNSLLLLILHKILVRDYFKGWGIPSERLSSHDACFSRSEKNVPHTVQYCGRQWRASLLSLTPSW